MYLQISFLKQLITVPAERTLFLNQWYFNRLFLPHTPYLYQINHLISLFIVLFLNRGLSSHLQECYYQQIISDGDLNQKNQGSQFLWRC